MMHGLSLKVRGNTKEGNTRRMKRVSKKRGNRKERESERQRKPREQRKPVDDSKEEGREIPNPPARDTREERLDNLTCIVADNESGQMFGVFHSA